MIAFIIGVFIGTMVGMIVCSLCIAIRDEGWKPIINGHWEINCDGWYPYCSNCHHEPKSGEMSNFCPHCGSYMKEGG